MEGRRVSRRKQRRNPLYVLFMALLAAVLVLLVISIVLGVKLGSARRDLAAAQTKIEQLQSSGAQQDGTLPEEPDGSGMPDDGQTGSDAQTDTETGTGDAPQTGTGTGSQTAASDDVIDWLDLTGHSEASVKPKSVYDKYYVYYTTAGVNLRAGPGTSYDKVRLVDLGTEVKAAAKQDGWTFVSVGGKFGWINSDYLSTTRPEPKPAQTASGSSGNADPASGSTTSSAGTANTGSTGSGTTGTTAPADGGSSAGNEMPEWLRNNG